MTTNRPVVRCTDPATIRPAVCSWCDGSGVEPDDDAIACLLCTGGGYAIVSGDLGATHVYRRGRPFVFTPRLNRLTVSRGRLVEAYTLAEFVPDPLPGSRARAFECVKDRTGEVYHLLATEGAGVTCDCAGKSYEATARANKRAWLEGREQVLSLGCVHADFLALALSAGLMDAG